MFERWRRRWRGEDEPIAPAPATPPPPPAIAAAPPSMDVDMARTLSGEFADEFPMAMRAAERVLAAIAGADLTPLARRSPALVGYDWTGYLRCSVARVVRVQRALSRHVGRGGAVLDFGSYFGNFALAIAGAGYRVTAADAYRHYAPALDRCVALMGGDGITVQEAGESARGLAELSGRFDAVVCAGVLEHIPHTPRLLLENVSSMLRPGGVLIVDTPNLAYLYHRLALMEGRSIFTPIERQFYTELPFEGHHREYTVGELEWMLRETGHEVLSVETFNYSYFSQAVLAGEHLEYFHAMMKDPSLREIILSVSRPRPRA